ncbi:MAG TPA: TetR/AcrR family transcriptional regulator [Anaerolineales bacterium]|nr:TetR/AcrR family transcriptional regulator [Anaerolineales bacterium]
MTRDEILDAAAQIFRVKGFHASSMQDIAQAVNLQKASLYHHVSSKQEILLALLDRAIDLLYEHIEQQVNIPISPDEKLRLAIRAYLQALLENRDLAAVLLLEHRSLEPRYHALHIPRRDRFERLWRDLILEGIQGNLFTSEDPAMASRALLGSMNWIITWYRPEGPQSPDEIATHFASLFLNGLLARQG